METFALDSGKNLPFSSLSEDLKKINHKKLSMLLLDQANILDGNILSNPSSYMENLTDLFIK